MASCKALEVIRLANFLLFFMKTPIDIDKLKQDASQLAIGELATSNDFTLLGAVHCLPV
jgi:hypothetical protein